MNTTAIVSVLCVFIGAPLIVFGFIMMMKKYKRDIDLIRYKKEILELEVEKEAMRIKAIEAENIKYDRIINNN